MWHLLSALPRADYTVVRRPGKSWLIFSAPLGFAKARERCNQEGFELVSVSSQEENQDLFNAAKSGGIVSDGFWIGLVAKKKSRRRPVPGRDVEGTPTTNKADWMWLSTSETPSFDGWSVLNGGQPDNAQGAQGVVARMQSDAAWGKPF